MRDDRDFRLAYRSLSVSERRALAQLSRAIDYLTQTYLLTCHEGKLPNEFYAVLELFKCCKAIKQEFPPVSSCQQIFNVHLRILFATLPSEPTDAFPFQ
jgi:hypothetical protein